MGEHFAPSPHRPLRTFARVKKDSDLVPFAAAVALGCLWLFALAAPSLVFGQGLAPQVLDDVRRVADDAARAVSATWPSARIEVEIGSPDPRLRLAPCTKTEVYLPAGVRLWGRARVGVRCIQGERAWNISLPVTVRVFAPSLAATQALAAGTVLAPDHLGLTLVDVAAQTAPIDRLDVAVGRSLARPLQAGDALQQAHLRARQFFAAGDTVRIVASGIGYAVSGQGQALGHGIEGRSVRVRTEAGRVVTGTPVGEHQVEVAL